MKNILTTLFCAICAYLMPEIDAKNVQIQSRIISKETNHSMQNVIKNTSITVYGNCSSCKKAIEKAAKSIEGVELATWDKKKKILTVQYDASKTSLDIIEKAITAIGYDTEHFRADDSIYDELHHCCKYDRKPL